MGAVKVFHLLSSGADIQPSPFLAWLPHFAVGLVLFAIGLLLAFLVVRARSADAHPDWMQRASVAASGIALVAALVMAITLALTGPLRQVVAGGVLPGGIPLEFTLYLDAVAAVMLMLVAFLGLVISRFSCRYLNGNPRQGRFLKWLTINVGMVLLLIVSGNLLLFAAAWMGTSLSLHQLLTFHRDRPGALLAARQKFIISRVGDICLLGALILVYQIFGTFDFATIFSAAETLRASGELQPHEGWQTLAFLLAVGALLKSAQFPFHVWLPDTLETPTPVSAMMHAGIINAGGFLVIRLSPLMMLAPTALDVLAVVGAVTAVYGSLVMMTQPTIKKMLAYSTIAQMGFMMLQCGLGLFALALLHIVVHSLYKAYAFLGSGGTAVASVRSGPMPQFPAASWTPFFAVLVSGVITIGWGALFGVSFTDKPGVLVLGLVLTLGLGQLLFGSFGRKGGRAVAIRGILAMIGVGGLYFTLHTGAGWVFGSALPSPAANRGWFDLGLMVAIATLFVGLYVLQTRLAEIGSHPVLARWYIRLLNGFSLDLIANRFVQRFWPVKTGH